MSDKILFNNSDEFGTILFLIDNRLSQLKFNLEECKKLCSYKHDSSWDFFIKEINLLENIKSKMYFGSYFNIKEDK